MPGNPKESKWRNTPRSARKRKKVEVHLSDEAKEKLERCAPAGRRSEWVEGLIMAAPEPEEGET